MSIQTDIVTALASVAGGRVYPQVAPQDAVNPFVVYRIVGNEPLMTLQGYAGTTKYTVEFTSIAGTYAESLSTAGAVQSAITTAFPGAFREPPPENQYIPEVDEYAESVTFSFWSA